MTIAATQTTATQSDDPVPAVVSSWMTSFLAIACGLVVANVYYPQPIAGPIGISLGLSPSATGLIVTATQAGFGIGLLLIVPLGDLIENRRLIVTLVGLAAVALLGAAVSSSPLPFLVSAVFLGLGSVAVQVLVPFAAHMAPENMRGRAVGNVMSRVMVGIMLARPASSFVTEIASWHVVFLVSAASMVALTLMLSFGLPKRVPVARVSYGALLKSMSYLAFKTAVLQRRALYQASLFGAFSLFWTTVPLLLVGPRFGLSQGGIALFGLAGGAGVIAAPIAGRLADKGWTRPATGFAILAVAAALLMTHFAADGSRQSLVVLIAAAILLDFGMTANLTLGQRAIFVLAPEFRGRLNGLYMAAFFVGGAAGSALGGWAYAIGGWPVASWIGFALPLSALIVFITELRARAG